MFCILIVDDNPIFRKVLRVALSSGMPGIRIEEAGDGDEAILKIESHKPHLILMDIRLPGENGLLLTSRIKGLHPDIRVLMISSCRGPEYGQASFQHGADGFFCKKDAKAEEIVEAARRVLLDAESTSDR